MSDEFLDRQPSSAISRIGGSGVRLRKAGRKGK